MCEAYLKGKVYFRAFCCVINMCFLGMEPFDPDFNTFLHLNFMSVLRIILHDHITCRGSKEEYANKCQVSNTVIIATEIQMREGFQHPGKC